jgi:hypothetical protein
MSLPLLAGRLHWLASLLLNLWGGKGVGRGGGREGWGGVRGGVGRGWVGRGGVGRGGEAFKARIQVQKVSLLEY